jgi:hypothetical protein
VPATALQRAVLLALAALAAACDTTDPKRPPPGSRNDLTCPQRFAACAPPVHYDETVDASQLDLRKQVHVSLRMDVPQNVARDAAALVLRRVETADIPGLLALSSIHEDEWAVLGKCQCPGEQNAWDRKRVGAALERRLPSAELRSPKRWEDRMVAGLGTIRELQRKMALSGLAGSPVEGLEAERRKADLELCEAVHGARTFLLPDAYQSTAEAVRRRRDADAGPASAEFAAAAIRGYEQSATCAPAPPAARPAPSPAAAPVNEDDEEQ